MVLMALVKIVKLKVKYERATKLLNAVVQEEMPHLVLFENITWKEMDDGLVHFFKYLANFFFYRFGLEICYLMTAITVAFRMDAYAILYGIWLGLLLNLKRTTVGKVWPAYFLFLLFFLALQYMWCLGLPPILCFEYPWSRSNQLDPFNIYNKVRKWLCLPDYSDPPKSHYLIVDFVHVIFVWLQLGVFKLENDQVKIDLSGGGSNDEIVYRDEPYKHNPFKDFISDVTTNFDKIKYAIFMYSYWIAIAVVYFAGTSRISLFGMGYLVFSFYFFWYGQTFLMKPLDKLLKSYVD